MNKQDKALLIGMSLGDGSLHHTGKITIEHSLQQEEFVKYKKELLERICTPYTKWHKDTKLHYRERLDKRTGKVYKQVSCHKTHKYLKVIHKWLYTPTKTYKRWVLNKLTPHAIAIWFADDGNLRKKYSTRTGKLSSIQVSLYTHCSYEQAEIVQKYFSEEWDVDFKIYTHKTKTSTLYYLCANTSNGVKFISLISPYKIPSMGYKIDLESTSAGPLKGGRRYSLNCIEDEDAEVEDKELSR